jgi:SH3-like domain-containing protein
MADPMRNTRFLAFFFGVVLVFLQPAASAAAEERGKVTNLPIPRYVSLKADEGNVRRGPSLSHRIDWVFKRRDMPLMITDEFGHWRRVLDRDGAGGWMHYSLLSGARTVIVEEDMAALRMKPDEDAPVSARAEAGVIAELNACDLDWCRIEASGQRGWVRKSALWGVAPEEIRE